MGNGIILKIRNTCHTVDHKRLIIMPKSNNIDVSVCIVNWNTKNKLRACLQSLIKYTKYLNYEVIVVENASADGSLEMLEEEFPWCKIIKSGKNLGFAYGNHVAVNSATGKYILYLNPDTELVSNVIYGMYLFMEINSNYAAVGPKIFNMDNSIQMTCASTYPTLVNELSEMFLLHKIFPKTRIFSTREMNYWDHENSREIDCLSGACMMIKKSVNDSLGGFDKKLFMYAEDVDLCYRLKKNKYKLYYLASEKIYHYEGTSVKLSNTVSNAYVMQKAANYYFIRKNYGLSSAVGYRIVVAFGSVFRLLAATIVIAALRIINNENRKYDGYVMKNLKLMAWSVTAGIK